MQVERQRITHSLTYIIANILLTNYTTLKGLQNKLKL